MYTASQKIFVANWSFSLTWKLCSRKHSLVYDGRINTHAHIHTYIHTHMYTRTRIQKHELRYERFLADCRGCRLLSRTPRRPKHNPCRPILSQYRYRTAESCAFRRRGTRAWSTSQRLYTCIRNAFADKTVMSFCSSSARLAFMISRHA